jgi:hypothetical protein
MRKKAPGAPGKVGKIAQLRVAWKMGAENDPKFRPIVIGATLFDFVLVLALGLLTGHPVFGSIMAVGTAILTFLFTFGSRAQKAAYAQIDGQPGAAAGVLNTLKKRWTVTPAVALSKNQDVVHRAVGRPGIVLIAEGAPSRLGNLLAAERKRMARFVADAPVHEIIVGDGDGQVPLAKLTKHLQKMKPQVAPGEVTIINDRLRAVGDVMKNVPMPKGPMPPMGGKQSRGKIR